MGWIHNFIFSVTYECVQEIRMLHYIRLQGLIKEKDSSILGQLVIYEEVKGCEYNSMGWIHNISFSP